MTLYQSTYLFAAILFVCGIFFFFPKFKPLVTAFPRSKTAAVVTFGGGGLWFLYILSTLGEADFGDIKIYLIAIFGVAGLLAFKYLDDFLSVRGLAILGLLLPREFLDSAFMQEPVSRLTLVSLSYIVVLASLYLGALPYRFRDFLEFLYLKPQRAVYFGVLLEIFAVSLVVSALFY